MALLDITNELLHNILIRVEPCDLAALSATCWSFRSFITANNLLHKDIYSRRYDVPKLAQEPNWEDELHRAAKLEKILESEDRDTKREHLAFVTEESIRLLERANVGSEDEGRNIELLSEWFADVNNKDTILCSSSLYGRSGTSMQQKALTPELRQASAHLHCLYGRPIDPVPSRQCHPHFDHTHFLTHHLISPDSSPSANTRQHNRDIPVHWAARAKVYDLREYTEHTLWGPFMDDGSHRVDWEKVEAIMVVLGFNMSLFHMRSDGRFPYVWEEPFLGAAPNSFHSPPPVIEPKQNTKDEDPSSEVRQAVRRHTSRRPYGLSGQAAPESSLEPSLDSLDPYGVTGTWMRVVCFLDYNDLYQFNFSLPHDPTEPRRPIDTQEGIVDLAEKV